MLVPGAHESPDCHGDATDRAGETGDPCVLRPEQSRPEQSVLRTLDEWYRDAFSNLTGVVHSKPLVCQVTAARDHELGSEHSPEGPTSNERGNERVGEPGERRVGPPPTLQDKPYRQRETNAPETREAPLPHRDPSSGMARVVAPVRRDVRGTGADQSTHHERCSVLWVGSDREVRLAQSPLRVDVRHVRSYCEPEAIDVKDEGTQVK